MKRFCTFFTVVAAVFCTLFCSTFSLLGQDVHFTQYYASPLTLNPALIGSKSEMKLTANYRSQWQMIKAYSTGQFTLLYPILVENQRKRLGGVGLSFLNDVAGDYKFLTTLKVSSAFSYNLDLGSHHALCIGLQASFIQKSLNKERLIFGDQYQGPGQGLGPTSENLNAIKSRVSYPDLSGGLLWFFSPDSRYGGVNAFSGVSVYHVLEPNESFMGGTSKLPMRLTYHGGVKFFSLGSFDFSPNVLAMFQGGAQEINFGGYAMYNFPQNRRANNLLQNGGIIFGVWYRNKDAVNALLGLEHENFSFGFSYDINTSDLSDVTNGRGASEISISLRKLLGTRRSVNNPSPGF